MNKNILSVILVILSLFFSACGNNKDEQADNQGISHHASWPIRNLPVLLKDMSPINRDYCGRLKQDTVYNPRRSLVKAMCISAQMMVLSMLLTLRMAP